MPSRSFVGGVANGTLFNLVNTLMDPSIVLVVFVSQLTDSTLLLGLVGVIRAASWFMPQLWASGYAQSLRRSMPIYRAAAMIRALIMLAMIVAVFTIDDNALLLAVFLACIVTEQLAAGVAGVPFLDIVGKVIKADRIGVFFSLRLGLGGLLGIGGGVVVRALLDAGSPHYRSVDGKAPSLYLVVRALHNADSPLNFPNNFGLLFALAVIPAVAAFLVWILLVDEPESEPRGPRMGLTRQLRRAGRVLRTDANYRTYLQVRISLMVVMLAVTPFVTVYAKDQFRVPLSALALYPSAIAGFKLLGTMGAGWASVRFGNRQLIRVGAGLGVLTLGMVLLAGPLQLGPGAASVYFGLVFGLAALRDSTQSVALVALNINVAPEDKRPLYLGFSNTVMGIALLLTSTLSGVLVESISFELFFVLALALSGFGVWRVRTLYDPTAR